MQITDEAFDSETNEEKRKPRFFNEDFKTAFRIDLSALVQALRPKMHNALHFPVKQFLISPKHGRFFNGFHEHLPGLNVHYIKST